MDKSVKAENVSGMICNGSAKIKVFSTFGTVDIHIRDSITKGEAVAVLNPEEARELARRLNIFATFAEASRSEQ